jgi:integrase
MPRKPKLPEPWQRQNRGNDWYVTIRSGTKQKQIFLAPAGAAPAVVQQELAKVLMQAAVETKGEDGAVLPLFERFLEHVQREQSPDTYRIRQKYLQSFVGFLKDKGLLQLAVKDMRPFHVSEWLDKNPQWGQSSRRMGIEGLMRALNWSVKQGYIEGHPLEHRVARPPRKSRGRDVYMDEATYKEWLGMCRKDCQRHVIMALYNTGCRPGEVCSLGEAEDTCFDERRRVWVVKGKGTKANPSGIRTVALPPLIVELSKHLREKNPTGALFRNTAGTPWRVVRLGQMFRRFRRQLARKYPERAAQLEKMIPYGSRHAWASNRLREGWTETHVAKQLGHQGTAVLHEHYNHVIAEDIVPLMEKIQRVEGEAI